MTDESPQRCVLLTSDGVHVLGDLRGCQAVSRPDGYPGRGRVLVLGLSPAVNRSVVEPLLEHGVDALGFTRPADVAAHFNARDFDLIVFGRGLLGPLSERLRRSFATDNPDIRFVNVIAPVAVEQTLAALARDPRDPRFLRDVEVSAEDRTVQVTATVLAPCRIQVTLFRSGGEGLVSEVLGQADAEPGPFSWTGTADDICGGNSLLVMAEEMEYHLHPFL
jgi:hypothetical protein